MLLSKIIALIFLVFYIEKSYSSETYCDGTGWEQFRDEKCYKLIQDWASRDQAVEKCTQEWLPQSDASTPQLVSIKSAEEQNFLTDYVFNKSAVEFNVWISAKRTSENANKFVWDDGSELEFTNWAKDSPSHEVRKGCVVMESLFTRNIKSDGNGKWRDLSCGTQNYVICEKLQRWSFSKLQQSFLATRKKLDDTEGQLLNTQSELSGTKIILNEAIKNPVPIGFIYVQLSNQPEPSTLWSAVQWKDVTSEYAGLFFRAEGGDAAQFGTVQQGNAPRVTQVQLEGSFASGSDAHQKWGYTTLNVGDKSSGFGVFSGSWDGNRGYTHRFYQSGGEVRPRNTAMRVWKRIT